MHDLAVNSISQFLSKTRITIIGGGGIAAIELPQLARELRRHGAQVHFCVTENCLKFVGLDSLMWASGHEVTINPTGLAQHICTSDLLLLAPATADLISKARHGLCSDGATTLIQSALGLKKTLIFCPTMHGSLASSPIIHENKEFLKNQEGVFFINPRQDEGKDKLQPTKNLALNIAHLFNKRKNFPGKSHKVAMTLGGTQVMLDPVRCITNLSSGNLGLEVAKYFYANGIELDLFIAHTNQEVPTYPFMKATIARQYQHMYDILKETKTNSYSGIIHLLAGSDFTPKQTSPTKLKSDEETVQPIELIKTPKIIDLANLAKIPFKAGAKLTSGEQKEGIKVAENLLREKKLNAILWNSTDTAWSGNQTHAGTFISFKGKEILETKVKGKKEIAKLFYTSFLNFLDGL